jgi:hypothetical protein
MKEEENENITFESVSNNKNKINYDILINNNNNNINNFFQANINQNIPYENEIILFNNFQNQNNSFNFQDFQNQNIMSQLTLQDLLSIDSLYTDSDIQRIENNCHYLQMKISANPIYANDVLFPFLFSNIVSLINDQFGSFIYQRFIDVINFQNLIKLLFIIKNNFSEISKNQNGTRIIQKLLEKSILIKQGNHKLFNNIR